MRVQSPIRCARLRYVSALFQLSHRATRHVRTHLSNESHHIQDTHPNKRLFYHSFLHSQAKKVQKEQNANAWHIPKHQHSMREHPHGMQMSTVQETYLCAEPHQRLHSISEPSHGRVMQWREISGMCTRCDVRAHVQQSRARR
jgi:hypothetical protein